MSNPYPDTPQRSYLVHALIPTVLTVLAAFAVVMAPAGTLQAKGKKVEAPSKDLPKIEKPTFEAWLARGPQYLLSQVVPVPVTEGTRFQGFRLTQWFPGHPGEIASTWIRPGDVITRINGRSVERPDQFLYLWKRLGESRRLMIEGWRTNASPDQPGRRPFAVTFEIVDAPASASPEAAPAPIQTLIPADIPRARTAPPAPSRPAPKTKRSE